MLCYSLVGFSLTSKGAVVTAGDGSAEQGQPLERCVSASSIQKNRYGVRCCPSGAQEEQQIGMKSCQVSKLDL